MTRTPGSHPADVKLNNKAAITRYFYEHGTSSKSAVLRALGLSKPTASGLIDELVETSVLRKSRLGDSTEQGGKRPQLFDFNEELGWVIGVHVQQDRVMSVAANLRVETRLRASAKAEGQQPAGIVSAIAQLVRDLTAEADRAGRRIVGIGVSSPGTTIPVGSSRPPVSSENQTYLAVAEQLTVYGVPVIVENEFRNIAVAEAWLGVGRDRDTSPLMILHTMHGLGTGMVERDHRTTALGARYSFGAFGHTTIKFDGPLCRCGNRGCWELYASEAAFLEATTHAAASWGLPSLVAAELRLGTPLTVAMLAKYYQAGDEFARTQVESYVDRLAVGIINLVNAFNLETVVLHGSLEPLGAEFLEQLTERVRGTALPPVADRFEVAYSPLGVDAALTGAVTAVIRSALEGGTFAFEALNRPLATRSGGTA